jgi:hypothetical protein
MLVLIVAATKILADKVGQPVLSACLPCWPACLICQPALLASLPACLPACLPCFVSTSSVVLKCIFVNLNALSNLFFLDIYGLDSFFYN